MFSVHENDLLNRSPNLLNRSPDLLKLVSRFTKPVSRFTKSGGRFTIIIVQINIIVLALRVTAALAFTCYYALKRHKRCLTNAITKFSKSVSRFSKV